MIDEQRILSVEPFADDYGDGEVVLSDRMVTAAKPHRAACACCGGDVRQGERHRARAEAYKGRAMTFRWCSDCCGAMAGASQDGGAAWEARIGIRYAREGRA